MSTAQLPVSDMLVTVKAREIQRGLLAEQRGDQLAAARHFRAAAHLELVLAADYEEGGQVRLARRSRISAATCQWRAGDVEAAREIFDDLRSDHPEEIAGLVTELERQYPIN